jgi:pimeloyl-ACP methyl ester carboxylesterase
MLDLVEDAVAVVHALGERSAVIVGHDWGATSPPTPRSSGRTSSAP